MKLALLLAMSASGWAQPVLVPKAQTLVDALLREHPEIQTIGLHATPPGETDNLNVACSKLSKVGKRSADIDMQVIATGRPYARMANKGAFDIGVPLADAAGRKVGMIVVVLPAARAKDMESAMHQTLAIRDVLQSRIPSLEALFEGATVVHNSPLVMVAQTPLPDFQGEFVALAVDERAGRLYAESAGSSREIQVFNLDGELIPNSGVAFPTGVRFTHSGAYDSVRFRRFDVDAVSGKVRVSDSVTNQQVALLEGAGVPGDVSFDSAGQRLLITGPQGIVVLHRRDGDSYDTVCRFSNRGGLRSIYLPSGKRFYVLHGRNTEDSAALQVYEVR